MHQTWTIPKMSCQGCVTNIGNALQQVPGVGAIETDLPAKRITVTFDENIAPQQKLIEALNRAGYPPFTE